MKYKVKYECYWFNTGAADNHYYEESHSFNTIEEAIAFKKRVDTQYGFGGYDPPFTQEEIDSWYDSDNYVEVENGFISSLATIVGYIPEQEIIHL